jgi:hypothetical protein
MDKTTCRKLILGYVAAVLVAWVGVWVLVSTAALHVRPSDRVMMPWLLGLATTFGLFVLFLVIGLGIWVYRDAGKRGMEPLLWALVAVLVPYFIGTIVYLVVRKPEIGPCPSCGQSQVAGAAFCATCGQPMKPLCASCKGVLPAAARFCPSCGAPVAARSLPGQVEPPAASA